MARETFGVVFKMGPAGGSLTALAGVTSVSPPNMTREALDVTSHGSANGAAEFIGDGVFDPGELTVSTNYVGGDATDDALIAALTSGDLKDFSFTVNAATGTETIEFSGIVTSYGPAELGVKGKQSATATIKVSGGLSQAPSA